MQSQGGAPLSAAPPGQPAGELVPQRHLRNRTVQLLVAVAAVTLLADVVSKIVVVATLSRHAPVTLIPSVLDLQLTRNGGAAFSLGTGATVVFTLVALGVVAAIVRTASRLTSRGWAVVLGLLLGGAIGNLVDRFARSPGPGRGEVVDWIHLHHWPVFNLADSAIVVGGLLAVVLSGRGVHAGERPGERS